MFMVKLAFLIAVIVSIFACGATKNHDAATILTNGENTITLNTDLFAEEEKIENLELELSKTAEDNAQVMTLELWVEENSNLISEKDTLLLLQNIDTYLTKLSEKINNKISKK